MTQPVPGRYARWSSSVVLLALLSADGGKQAWAQKPEAMAAHTDAVTAVAFSPDGKLLATGGVDRLVKVWDVATRKERWVLKGHGDAINGVAFSPDGTLLASASADKTIKLWHAASGQERTTLKDHTGSIWCLAFAPDGKTLASGGNDKVVRLWDVARGEVLARLAGPTDTVECLAFSPDGQTLVTAEGLAGIRVWDMTTRKERSRPNAAAFGRVAFTADGKLLAIPSGNRLVFVELATGKARSAIKMPPALRCFALTFSRDGKWLAASAGRTPQDGSVRLWQMGVAEPRGSLGNVALDLAFSPDSRTLVLGCSSGEVLWWRLPQPR